MSTALEGTPDLSLGHWLRLARERKNMSQAETALALGKSRPLVSRWERSTSYPDVNEFRRLAELYDAPWLWDVAATCSAWYAHLDPALVTVS